MKATDPQEFSRAQLPVVCLLATVREPVSLEQLGEWSKLPAVEVRSVIRQWREFLNEERTPTGEPRYRLYHASLADFLDAEEGLRQYHELLAADALERIPGFSHTGQ